MHAPAWQVCRPMHAFAWPHTVPSASVGYAHAPVAVRSHRAPGWFLPVAGGLLFSLLVLAVLTSAVWYIAAEGWPGPAS